MAERWQPTRAGVLNVWRYADEVFEFHRGRLLLRGPNGSGKSMALELLLPFLLDANARPERLSSGARSRGGLFDRVIAGADGSGRVGYLWAEFRRGDEAVTIGVRLRASTGTRTVDSTWFTTDRVVGRDLALLDETRTPLSKAALEAALGEAGTVHASADDYRQAVRTRLFPGFGADQYDAAITTLLALRKEKISQDLSPAKLSEVLSSSLPPLDDYEVAEVAEGFEKLDRRRDQIERLQGEVEHGRRLAARQRAHARVVLAARANAVRTTETERDTVTRQAREAADALGARRTHHDELAVADAAAARRVGELAAEVDALTNLDAYKAGTSLHALAGEVARAGDRLAEDDQAVARQQRALDETAMARDDAAGRRDEARANEQRARSDLDAEADRSGAGGLVVELAAAPPDEAEALAGAWTADRRRRLDEVSDAVHALRAAVGLRDERDRQVESDRAELDDDLGGLGDAERALRSSGEAFVAEVGRWAGSCQVLDPDALRRALPVPPDDPAAVATTVAPVVAEGREVLAVERDRLDQHAAELELAETALREERAEVAAGRTAQPEPVSWRSARDEARPGAALWRLVDVAPNVDRAVLDRVEAGLLAAGLLDAWIAPDGTVDLPGDVADAGLDALSGEAVAGPSLADVLVALDDTPVAATVVTAVLHRIALRDTAGDGGPAIGRDGTFRLGPLVGRGPDQPAGFVGATAQERRRAARLAEIDAELGELVRRRDRVRSDIEALDRRRQALDAEAAALPDGAGVARAAAERDRAEERVAGARARLAASETRRDEAEHAVKEAQRRLMQLAAAHGLPTDDEGLRAAADRLAGFERSTTSWINRRRDAQHATVVVDRLEGEATRAAAVFADAVRRRQRAQAEHGELEARLSALEATVGAEYREVAARVEQATEERARLEREREERREQLSALDRDIGRLETALDEAERRRAEADERRDEAHGSFVATVADGFAADAGLPIDVGALGGVTAVLDAARSVAASVGDLIADAAALSRALHAVEEAVHAARQGLEGRVEVVLDQSERGWWLLRAAVDGIRHRASELADRLAAELTTATDELLDEERRLFDETLTGSVRRAVAERIRRANDLVDRINGEQVKVRTEAAGLQVRLKWEVDPEQPDAVRAARRLLLKDPSVLTDAERRELHAFVRARLDEARARLDGSAGWETRLREALDYRAWHRFVLEVAHRDWEGFAPATANRLAKLSTGERSIALHLPMLASVAAHYDGAGDESVCPRLILLDELFAGVDAANRGQLFGMLRAWDLDAVLTSDHEWCAYSSLDGIAIHHLHPAADGEPVTSTRFVWDGADVAPAPLTTV